MFSKVGRRDLAADSVCLHRTFQLGFIFSLIVGLGVGEMMFGRFGLVA